MPALASTATGSPNWSRQAASARSTSPSERTSQAIARTSARVSRATCSASRATGSAATSSADAHAATRGGERDGGADAGGSARDEPDAAGQ